MSENLQCKPGDRVEAYRENTPEKVEWTGVVEHIRPKGGQYTVRVDGLIVRTGPPAMLGGPVKIAFSSKGVRVAPTYGAAMMIRKVAAG